MRSNVYRRNLFIPFLKILADIVTIEMAVLFAYYLRFHSPLNKLIPVTKGYPLLAVYFQFSFLLVAVMVGLFSLFYTYRSRFFSSFTQDIPVVLKVCFLGMLFAMSGAFLYRDVSYSRVVFLLIFINTNVFLLMERFFFHRLKKYFIAKGYSVLKVILIGSCENIANVYDRLRSDLNYKFDITGYVADRTLKELPVAHVGELKDIAAILKKAQGCDGLIISFNHHDHPQNLEVIKAAEGKNFEIFYVPDILDILTPKYHSLEVGGIPLLQLKSRVLSGWQGLIKRSFDVFVSALGLIFLSPLFLFVAAVIKATSPGAVFFSQKRVSFDGKEFNMLKFRSMTEDAEIKTGPVWTKKHDPRVTGIGKILRRSSLDELPQLINVLKGEMSLVGPRPERKHFVEKFQQSIPQYLERHRVRCGMTGWAQVNGLRGQSPINERTRYDLFYIENWSLWFDLKIIIMTFMEIVRGKNAY